MIGIDNQKLLEFISFKLKQWNLGFKKGIQKSIKFSEK